MAKRVPKIILALILALPALRLPAGAQRTPQIGSAELIQTLDRLNTLGSLLMVAAHPDDENTAVIAYFARGRHIRTAYLSATRGEGGQNLIGSEQYEAMGLIRTQELMTARKIDGGLQFFTRAFDYGFSKNPDEAFQKWGRDRLLADVVRTIRRFQPDVIVQRFPPPPGSGGHGQHTATGYIAPVAFEAAADPAQFPDQVQEGLTPWRAKRLVYNAGGPGRGSAATARATIDAGKLDFVLGKSYAEIAAESRSQHASQGFGSAEPKGPSRQSFVPVAGDTFTNDLFDGIDTTWNRVPGAARVGELLARAKKELDVRNPVAILPLLIEAYAEMDRLNGPWVEWKRPELVRAIQLAGGLWLDAAADRWDAVQGTTLNVTLSALNRSAYPMVWERSDLNGAANPVGRPLAGDTPQQVRVPVPIGRSLAYTQPFWMREPRTEAYYPISDAKLIGLSENQPFFEATFFIRAGEKILIPMRLPVRYRWVDRVTGPHDRSVEIVPPVSVAFTLPNVIFPEARPRPAMVRVTALTANAKGTVSLSLPAGWKASPATADFALIDRSQQASLAFDVTPPAGASGGSASAQAQVNGITVSSGLVSIEHDHIPPQVYFPPAGTRLERFDVRMTAKNIGYVMGAGDEIPQAIEQLGATVHLLTANDLASGDLSRYDAIVTGVRAANVRTDLLAARRRLLDYVSNGGTLIEQYNNLDGAAQGRGSAALAPYPLTPSQNRVTVEEAPVTFPNPDHPLLHRPNEITARDFDGWVQERGLYFASRWDSRYQPVFACNDPGEQPQLGGTLYTQYGKGVFVFTAYAWFRQLPAGVPGAYRIFANILSAGK